MTPERYPALNKGGSASKQSRPRGLDIVGVIEARGSKVLLGTACVGQEAVQPLVSFPRQHLKSTWSPCPQCLGTYQYSTSSLSQPGYTQPSHHHEDPEPPQPRLLRACARAAGRQQAQPHRCPELQERHPVSPRRYLALPPIFQCDSPTSPMLTCVSRTHQQQHRSPRSPAGRHRHHHPRP